MKALLVIDAQNGIVNFKDFSEELSLIEKVIRAFKAENLPVIFMKQVDDMEESPLYKDSSGSDLHHSLNDYADYVVEKKTPSSFYNTKLSEVLDKLNIDHLYVTGFNTEFCCMFTAISAFDRGYKVTFIEDATGTVNSEEEYEMPGLDIRDFVGTALHWTNAIEVLDYEEFEEEGALR
ncbi:isochorismatase family protein [Alkalibacillus haloalkaliphilus]|uniref:isochorismatase family protein n=1 Tax=Alkalibacillus haloalkaliphilus TaxID=94136 RepID=UPI0002F4176F|nr:isochorismatase family protein [Alkalibacillus haloalkaliphilus]